MKTFILCSGRQERFPGKVKQFLTVDGVTLIDRILSQVKIPAFIVSDKYEFKKYPNVIIPRFHSCTLETLRSTSKFWSDINVILLGDVYYTDNALEKIFQAHQKLRFFTDGQDIFAIKFTFAEGQRIYSFINRAIETKNNRGRLWELYRQMHDIIEFPKMPEHKYPQITFIDDKTQDFDTMEDYENFLNGISKNIIYKKCQK